MIKSNRLISCALNPASFFKMQGIQADPWQESFLLAAPQLTLLNCSRQVGKSTTVAALALHTALFQPNSLILLLSPSQRQSGEIFRKVLDAYSFFNTFCDTKHLTRTQLELTNGSRIISLPGKEQYIRSFGGVSLLVLDEAARIPDDLYRAVRPMLAVSGGKLAALSTPFGKKGWFYDAWHSTEPWHRIEIPWNECPRISPEFICQEVNAMGSDWVDQEYQCVFSHKQGKVYTDFDNCLTSELPLRKGRFVGGIDFGWHNPFAAVWGFLDEQQNLFITNEHYVTHATVDEISKILPRNVTWWADPSGPADIAALNRSGLIVRKGDNSIRTGIAAVSSRIRLNTLKVLANACPNLVKEAGLYRYPETGGEKPLDADNHALAALRYLIASIDRKTSVLNPVQKDLFTAQKVLVDPLYQSWRPS